MELTKLEGVKQAIAAKKAYYEMIRDITERSGVIFPELSSHIGELHIYNGISELGIDATTEPLLCAGVDNWGTESAVLIDGVKVYQLCKYGQTKEEV